MSRKYVVGWDKENVLLQETDKQIEELRKDRKDRDDPIFQMKHVYFIRTDTKMLISLDDLWYLSYKDNLPGHVKALLYIHGIL